jgi:hypothetical protein
MREGCLETWEGKNVQAAQSRVGCSVDALPNRNYASTQCQTHNGAWGRWKTGDGRGMSCVILILSKRIPRNRPARRVPEISYHEAV